MHLHVFKSGSFSVQLQAKSYLLKVGTFLDTFFDFVNDRPIIWGQEMPDMAATVTSESP
jgi:hypothetical protein